MKDLESFHLEKSVKSRAGEIRERLSKYTDPMLVIAAAEALGVSTAEVNRLVRLKILNSREGGQLISKESVIALLANAQGRS